MRKELKEMIASDYQEILRDKESRIWYFIKRMFYKLTIKEGGQDD